MKKLGLAVLLTVASFSAYASDGGGSDGCGLGWQVTSKKSFLATTTRGTTNAVVHPTFGMTSGTIGCDQHSFAKRERQAVDFVASNKDPLIIDMSQGKGEYLHSFFKSMGCNDAAFGAFGKVTQSNFKSITSGKTPVDMYNNVKSHMRQDTVLSHSCALI